MGPDGPEYREASQGTTGKAARRLTRPPNADVGRHSEKWMEAVLTSRITCPQCGATAAEQMPTNACVYFYECAACHELLQPLPGDCCVFCSFGDVKCPPVQLEQSCCAGKVAQ